MLGLPEYKMHRKGYQLRSRNRRRKLLWTLFFYSESRTTRNYFACRLYIPASKFPKWQKKSSTNNNTQIGRIEDSAVLYLDLSTFKCVLFLNSEPLDFVAFCLHDSRSNIFWIDLIFFDINPNILNLTYICALVHHWMSNFQKHSFGISEFLVIKKLFCTWQFFLKILP